MGKRKLKKSFFLILLVIFIVVITPVYLLCYGIYQWGYRMTTNEISQSLHSRASYFMTRLENEIKQIRMLEYECLNDENLFYFVNASQIMSKYENINNRLALQKRLHLLQESSDYIENVSVWMPRVSQMISATRGVDPLTDEWKRILSAEPDGSEAGILYLDGAMYLCSAYPTLPADLSASPLYILIVQLSTDIIEQELLSFNLYPEGGTMLSSFGQDHHMVVGKDIQLAERIRQNEIRPDGWGTDFTTRSQSGEKYIVFETTSGYLNMKLCTYVSDRALYGDLYRYRNLFISFTALAFALVAAYLWGANLLVNKPVKLLVQSLTRVEHGELQVRIEHHSNDEFSYLYTAFNQMAASLENMFEINYKQRILTQEAELRQLQAQINPHFLHNSFFILYRMAKDEDYENITEFLTYLSEYYRYITRNAQLDVPLSDEVNHAEKYAAIQLVRFKRRISVDFEPLPSRYRELPVPRLILQPLLENAFNHGLKDVAADGRLRVWYAEEGEKLLLHVEDNGAGIGADELAVLRERMDSADDSVERTGIINIHRRLRLKFGRDYGLSISSLDPGIRFTLMLPAVTKTTDKKA